MRYKKLVVCDMLKLIDTLFVEAKNNTNSYQYRKKHNVMCLENVQPLNSIIYINA